MINKFLQNRRRIHELMKSCDLIYPLQHYDSEITVEEKKAGNSKLRFLTITNIPVCKKGSLPLSWTINTEIKNSIFSLPPDYKTVDSIIAVFSCTTLYFIMIEMKTTLSAINEGLNEGGINKKIADSITKIESILPLHVFNENYKDLDHIKYLCFICYNKNRIPAETQEGAVQASELSTELFNEYEKHVSINRNPRQPISITDDLGELHKVDVAFIKNTTEEAEEMEIDLDLLLSETNYYADFQCSIYSEYILPEIP